MCILALVNSFFYKNLIYIPNNPHNSTNIYSSSGIEYNGTNSTPTKYSNDAIEKAQSTKLSDRIASYKALYPKDITITPKEQKEIEKTKMRHNFRTEVKSMTLKQLIQLRKSTKISWKLEIIDEILSKKD
ncbi:hypothetical protein FACS189459_6190 [Bacilli bacterium]|nr:hypothetical protein FACS189459_6190 [Bacilli bacterium]